MVFYSILYLPLKELEVVVWNQTLVRPKQSNIKYDIVSVCNNIILKTKLLLHLHYMKQN